MVVEKLPEVTSWDGSSVAEQGGERVVAILCRSGSKLPARHECYALWGLRVFAREERNRQDHFRMNLRQFTVVPVVLFIRLRFGRVLTFHLYGTNDRMLAV